MQMHLINIKKQKAYKHILEMIRIKLFMLQEINVKSYGYQIASSNQQRDPVTCQM